MKPSRSLLVSWLLGATVVALVTFSFEALSERESFRADRPSTEAVTTVVAAYSPASAATAERGRCPATGALAPSTKASGRCPVSGATAGPATAEKGRCPVTGQTAGGAAPSARCPVTGASARPAGPATPSGRCPAGGDPSVPLRAGHTI